LRCQCPICDSPRDEIFRSALPFSVRSDWTPVRSFFSLFYCENCNHLFKDDETVMSGCDYESYELWGNETTGDKIIFENGVATVGKSKKIFDFLERRITNFSQKSLLDFGCQRGAFLSQLSNHKAPLAGLDVSEKYREGIQSLGSLYYGPNDEIKNKFDIVTLIHVLEHLVELETSLFVIKNAIKSDGKVFVQVPDVANQPTDSYVIDHKHHFSKRSLVNTFSFLLELEGHYFENIVPGELSSMHTVGKKPIDEMQNPLTKVVQKLLSIEKTVARINSGVETVALYGAGMLGSLFYANLEQHVKYFVDDDPKLEGKTLHGRPIYSVANRPDNIPILNCLPQVHAALVRKRFKNDGALIELF